MPYRPIVIVLLSSLGTVACSAPAATAEPVTYYVNATGDDSASGLNPDSAWGSLDRVTAQDLAPGDTVVLTGAEPLVGSLRLTREDGGDAANPVRIKADSSFPGIEGQGRAGIDITDTSGVLVEDLIVRVTDAELDGTNGVLVTVGPGGGIQRGITLRSLTIESAYQGVAIGAENAGDRLENVVVERVRVTDALRNGIVTYGTSAPDFSLTDVRVTDSVVTGTRGIPGEKTNTGSGIVVGSADGALIEGNESSYNGGLADAGEGPIGIWTHDSKNVVIRDNVSHHNQTQWTDGGGFGVDISTTDVIVEHNLSHDNYGSGYLLYTREDASPTGRVTIRYNASVGDARLDHFPAGLAILGGLTKATPDVYLHDIHVHHNTVIPDSDSGARALLLMGTVNNLNIHHNILDASTGWGPAVGVEDWASTGELQFSANQLSVSDKAARGVLSWNGYLIADVNGLRQVFPAAAGNVKRSPGYRDITTLPEGLALSEPASVGVQVPEESEPALIDLLGEPVTEPNPVIGAVSRHG